MTRLAHEWSSYFYYDHLIVNLFWIDGFCLVEKNCMSLIHLTLALVKRQRDGHSKLYIRLSATQAYIFMFPVGLFWSESTFSLNNNTNRSNQSYIIDLQSTFKTKHNCVQLYKGTNAHKYYALGTLKFRHRLFYIDILYCLWYGQIKTWYIGGARVVRD